MKRLLPILLLFFAVLPSCGGGTPPKGTIGCSCRQLVDATCEGIEAPKGLETELLNTCEMSFEPECLSTGGFYDPVLPCPSENRYAVCDVELPATGLVRVKIWKTPDWSSADDTDIESDCDALGGTLRFE